MSSRLIAISAPKKGLEIETLSLYVSKQRQRSKALHVSTALAKQLGEQTLLCLLAGLSSTGLILAVQLLVDGTSLRVEAADMA